MVHNITWLFVLGIVSSIYGYGSELTQTPLSEIAPLESLRSSVEGRLFRGVPFASACYDHPTDTVNPECSHIQSTYTSEGIFDGCVLNITYTNCMPDSITYKRVWRIHSVSMGNVPSYRAEMPAKLHKSEGWRPSRIRRMSSRQYLGAFRKSYSPTNCLYTHSIAPRLT